MRRTFTLPDILASSFGFSLEERRLGLKVGCNVDHHLKYPVLQFLADPHHLTDRRAGQDLPPRLACLQSTYDNVSGDSNKLKLCSGHTLTGRSFEKS